MVKTPPGYYFSFISRRTMENVRELKARRNSFLLPRRVIWQTEILNGGIFLRTSGVSLKETGGCGNHRISVASSKLLCPHKEKAKPTKKRVTPTPHTPYNSIQDYPLYCVIFDLKHGTDMTFRNFNVLMQ